MIQNTTTPPLLSERETTDTCKSSKHSLRYLNGLIERIKNPYERCM